jgi:hypothetical protein
LGIKKERKEKFYFLRNKISRIQEVGKKFGNPNFYKKFKKQKVGGKFYR